MFLKISLILLILIISLFYIKSTFAYVKPAVYNNLITPQEAEYILNKSKDAFKSSTTIGGLDLNVRKSETMWITKDDPIVKNIYSRLSKQFSFNVKNAEQLQVVKYTPGGFYKQHHDACCGHNCDEFLKDYGQRVLTILIYLNDDFEEGSTKFPTLNLNIKPPKYSGIVFYPLDTNKKCHPDSLHTGTPVKSGTKYVCNIWIREKEVN